MAQPVMAFAWLREEDWPRWREIDADLQPEYGQWLRKSEGAIAELRRRGCRVEKIVVTPDAYLAWPKPATVKTHRDGRAAIAAYLLARKLTDH